MKTKSLEELDKMREDRDINTTLMSEAMGCHPNTWRNAVKRDVASDRLKRNALRVIQFYDNQGIIPIPGEIELEPVGHHPKN